MPLDRDKLASALDLTTDDPIFPWIELRVGEWISQETQGLERVRRVEAERLVSDVLVNWRRSLEETGKLPTGATWQVGVERCLHTARQRLETKREEWGALVRETATAHEVLIANGERMDREAESKGLPKLEEYVDALPQEILGEADLDKVVAARLEKPNHVLLTHALSSCTGVSLFDPETRVGAVMHVYKGEVKIEHALEAMRKLEPSLDPGRLQVGIMPGCSRGMNTSHQDALESQLNEAGITHVRNFAAEGRTATSIFLRANGTLQADLNPDVVKQKVVAPVVESQAEKEKVSVRDVMRMGKRGSTDLSNGVGEGVSNTEGKLKRSSSEPNLRAGRLL